MALSKFEKIELAVSIYEFMVAGESDDAIISTLGLKAEDFREAKRFMLECKAAEVRDQTREEVYVQYSIEQRGIQRQVDTLLTSMSGADGRKHYNAFVGALRLKSDIGDRILERGFDLGVIRKTAEQREMVGGVVVSGMTDEELAKSISELSAKTAALVAAGERDFLEIDPGTLHYGPGVMEAVIEDDEALLPAPAPLPTEKRKAVPTGGAAKSSAKPVSKVAPSKR